MAGARTGASGDSLRHVFHKDWLQSGVAAANQPEFFYQEDGLAGLPLSIHPMNRRKASIADGVLRQAHAELNIRLIHLRRYLRAIDLHPELPCPLIDVDEGDGPQEVARTIRRTWSIPDGPIENLTDYCERAGIVVAWCEFEAPIDGVTMTVRDLPPCIFFPGRPHARIVGS